MPTNHPDGKSFAYFIWRFFIFPSRFIDSIARSLSRIYGSQPWSRYQSTLEIRRCVIRPTCNVKLFTRCGTFTVNFIKSHMLTSVVLCCFFLWTWPSCYLVFFRHMINSQGLLRNDPGRVKCRCVSNGVFGLCVADFV